MSRLLAFALLCVCLICVPAYATDPMPVPMWSEPAPLPCALWAEPVPIARSTPLALPLFGEPPVINKTPTVKSAGYPLRPRETWWTGCPMDLAGARLHMQAGEHAQQFDPKWIETLTIDQLQSLHSDHHEQRTAWGYVQRPAKSAVKPQPAGTSPYLQWQSLQNCPGGVCPKRG